MDVNRAMEIINSENNIPVTYNGKSVWINSINPHNGQVFIDVIDSSLVNSIDDTNEVYEVSISDLVEQYINCR